MYIEVSGHRSKKLKDEIACAAEFYASILLPKAMLKHIELEIHLKKKLDDDASGYCEYVDKYRMTKEFKIELDKEVKKSDLLQNLAHEMTHLKQFALGELDDGLVRRTTRWHGKEYDENKLDYWDEPWEIEAFGRELGLYSRYVEIYGI